jgi:hypothetical protein
MNDNTPGAAQLLDALAAVREALDIPNAATVGDQETRDAILVERARHAVVMLAAILDGDAPLGIPWSVAYLRARLAEHPAAGYKTWDERVAELDAAKASVAPGPDASHTAAADASGAASGDVSLQVLGDTSRSAVAAVIMWRAMRWQIGRSAVICSCDSGGASASVFASHGANRGSAARRSRHPSDVMAARPAW